MGSYAIVGAHMPIAAGRGVGGAGARDRAGRRLLLRRRDHEHRRVPRGAQPGRRLEAAGRLRLREQPLHGVHPDRRRDRGRASGGRPGVRVRPRVDRRSTATTPTRCTRPRRRVVDRARAGEGPSLVEAMTYRHGGHSRADPGKYRPDDEVAAWLGRDPIPMYRERLVGRGRRRRRARRDRRRGRARRSTARPRSEAPRRRPDAASLDDAAVGRRGVRMAELTYREAVARGDRAGDGARPDRRLHRRGRRGRRRRVQDDRGAARPVRSATACATRRSPSRRSSAPRWARR